MSGWLDHIQPIAIACSVLIAALTFHRNNRIKAAEILINIEREYACHLDVLLQIESLDSYEQDFKIPIMKSIKSIPDKLNEDEIKIINKLETTLRYFYICENVRSLSVDAGSIDRLCGWYLRILVTETDEQGEFKRPDLRNYVRSYWPTVYFWAPLAPMPGPKKIFIVLSQLKERIIYWWTGSWAKPPA